jgi:hypothetical protein
VARQAAEALALSRSRPTGPAVRFLQPRTGRATNNGCTVMPRLLGAAASFATLIWEHTMYKTTLIAAVVAAGVSLGLAGCDVKKTQEGSVTLPKYEVKKEQSGQITPPKYEVTPPDVKVGSAEKTITVPKVTTEEKKIEVPTVQVTPADKK